MRATRHPQEQFASDNCSGMCPEAMEALTAANEGHQPSYGTDRWTVEACDLFRDLFGVPCEVFFVLTGTAGNSLTLASMCSSYHAIICHRTSHVEADECGAPEFFSNGAKLLLAEGDLGKIDPRAITEIATRRNDLHYPKPRVVTVTQTTEMGTVYKQSELLAIREACDRHKLKLHMDGARFANAVASLDCPPRAITADCKTDVLVFGGSKNGMSLGEAVVFFDLAAADEFEYRCKQAGQLASKMRFIAAQWHGLLSNGAWLRNARHANDSAAELEARLRTLPEIEIMMPREANAVFVRLPERVHRHLTNRGWEYSRYIIADCARLMCSWNTTEEAITQLVEEMKTGLTAKA